MIFRFGDFEIDTDAFELRHQGEPRHVEPQVFDVLRYLVEHRDRVVAKDELLDNVWGDRFVSESALTSRIKAARQAVDDDGRAQRVISTAHGRGYRFIASVSTTSEAALTPPTGLATTLFTDIVGSTDLNAGMGDARWSALLDQHDRIMCDAVAAGGGRLVKSTGDGVLAVFDSSEQALRAALHGREQLAELGIHIRAGVHASEIETRGDDVAGLGVTIAARLLETAAPGEIHVSAAVREMVDGSGISFAERGPQTLKGIPGTWWTHAVVGVDPASASTTPRARRRGTNLPQVSDPFLGRDDDLQRVAAAVAQSRFVTLAGPAGVGKTRLAIEFAQTYSLECWFVDLSRVTDPSLVARSFLDTLGASPRQDVADCDRIVETLEPRSLLLLVDNCEQVIDAVAEILGRIENETAGVRVLATTRQALNMSGEQVLMVAPLGLPDAAAPVAEQRDADAVRMFVDRAERAGATVDDIAAVVSLCRRLDGMPLALELAAARMRAFSASQILEQLDAGWSISIDRRAHGPAHHVSLDDAIDWSIRLLDEGERTLLEVLSTFRGPFDLAAASAIAACDVVTTADRLAQLVDKSLVQSAPGRAGRRFRLLETLRAFASTRIADDSAASARERHCAYFASEVEKLGELVPGPDEDTAAARLAMDFDDVCAAFGYAAAHGDIEHAARLALGPRLSVSVEGARWAQLALRAVDLPGIERLSSHVSLLASAAWGAVVIGDLPRARALAQRGIAIVGDPAQHPRLCWIWTQATGSSFAEGAAGCLAGAREAAAHGDAAAESFLVGTASIYALAAGDEEAAVGHARRAFDLAHGIGSRSLQTRAAGALAYALQDLDATAARRAAEQVLELAVPGDFHLSMPHRVLATLAWRAGDREAAFDHATQAAYLIRDQGDRYVQATSVRQLAVIIGDENPEVAAELLGAADGLVPKIRVSARDAAAGTQLRQKLAATLGGDRFSELVDRGRRSDALHMYATVDRALRQIRQFP